MASENHGAFIRNIVEVPWRGMHHHACCFIDHQQITILIDHINIDR